ncbi:hypothetical protein [Paenibacillus montanisoli]|nr:hypothetical protein [Paenibacillus montanisoli]
MTYAEIRTEAAIGEAVLTGFVGNQGFIEESREPAGIGSLPHK